jgi:hypothetical protein
MDDVAVSETSAPADLGQKTEILPVADASAPQSNIKTEVMGSDFGAAEYLGDVEIVPTPNTVNENSGQTAPQNFTGDKTMPLIDVDQQAASFDPAQTQPVAAFDSASQAQNFAATAENPFQPATQNYEAQPQPVNAPPVVQPQKTEKKKSKGFLFAILGGLFGLFVLAAAGGGIAYYMMYYQGSASTTNTATPTPVPTATPTPEKTPEQANTNLNSNSDVVTAPSPDNSATNVEPSPNTQQTPVTTRSATPRPTQLTTNTPRPTTPKPTTKPETKPTLRGTTIPQ